MEVGQCEVWARARNLVGVKGNQYVGFMLWRALTANRGKAPRYNEKRPNWKSEDLKYRLAFVIIMCVILSK